MSESIVYIMKVYKPGTKLYRVLEVPGSATLEELHAHIHEYLEFPTEESYAFFPDNKLFSAAGYYAPQLKKRSAAGVRLSQLHLKQDQRILYVYDLNEVMQFYIHIEDIVGGTIPEIRLLRRNGHISFDMPMKSPAAAEMDPDTWILQCVDEPMEALAASQDKEMLLATAYSMNLEIKKSWSRERIAATIVETLLSNELMAFRMLSLESLRILEAIWRSAEGTQVRIPFEQLLQPSLLGFIRVVEENEVPVLQYSKFGREWMGALLESTSNLVWLETYMRWSDIAKGILRSYGIIQMDDFYGLMKKYIPEKPDVKEACDFMMQRMEWNDECQALQDGEEWYWSITDPEQAQKILGRRQLYDLDYKPLTAREIHENADSAGWQKVTCTQELFSALQGMAKSPDETKEMLTGIVDAFAAGLEPYEVMNVCLPPASQVGRPLYNKIRRFLRMAHRQLPDYGLKGYTEEEAENLFPDLKISEGITIIKGKL